MNQVDLLIIGAGPAGMAAALAAAPSGASIALLDDNPLPGGQIWRDGPNTELAPQARQMRAQLAGWPNIRLHSATKVIALASPHTLLVEDPEQGWLIHYQKLILCTGARELLLPFPGWTLPGVTGAGGLQALIKGGMPIAGKHVVIAGSGPLLMAVAKTVLESGGKLTALAEHRSTRELAKFTAGLT